MYFYRYRRRIYGIIPVHERLLRFRGHSNNFQERIDRTLELKHPAWLDDIVIVTKEKIEKQESEVKETMRKLDEAGYRLYLKICKFSRKEAEWVGHQINQDGIRPLQRQIGSDNKNKQTKNEKELKLFLGAIQYLSKYIKNISAQTDILRKLLQKQNEWIWTEEHTEAFNKLKKLINQLPGLAHFNSNKENILTTDASTKGLGVTQKQKDGNLKPVGFASRFLSDTEKK